MDREVLQESELNKENQCQDGGSVDRDAMMEKDNKEEYEDEEEEDAPPPAKRPKRTLPTECKRRVFEEQQHQPSSSGAVASSMTPMPSFPAFGELEWVVKLDELQQEDNHYKELVKLKEDVIIRLRQSLEEEKKVQRGAVEKMRNAMMVQNNKFNATIKASDAFVKILKAEVQRWQGDRQETSKELEIKLNAAEAEHEQTFKRATVKHQMELRIVTETCEKKEKELVECYAQMGHVSKELEEQQKAMVLEKGRHQTEKASLSAQLSNMRFSYEAKLSEQKADFEYKLAEQTAKSDKEIKDLRDRLEASGQHFDFYDKGFSSRLAQEQSKWLQTNSELTKDLAGTKDELAYWNTEALRVSKLAISLKKVLRDHGISVEEVAKQQSLDTGTSNAQLEKVQTEKKSLLRKIEDLKKENALQARKASRASSIMRQELDIHRMLTCTLVKLKEDNIFCCKCVSEVTHQMVEFNLEILPDMMVYQSLRLQLDDLQHLKGRKVIQRSEFLHFMMQVFHIVHSTKNAAPFSAANANLETPNATQSSSSSSLINTTASNSSNLV